jgi:hypothetical protein
MSEIVTRNGNEITLQVTVKLTGSLMEMENAILDGCNEIGILATIGQSGLNYPNNFK